MAQPRPPRKVKYFVGMLGSDTDLLKRARQLLARAWGEVELVSDHYEWNWTDYYAEEMGTGLVRQFAAFVELGHPDRLVELKRLTNEIEAKVCEECLLAADRRPVNLDPGYLTTAKLVLASMKDFSHRIYLGRGVYGEITLYYQHEAWRRLPWTFPDFASATYHPWLSQVRRRYKEQVEREASGPAPGAGEAGAGS